MKNELSRRKFVKNTVTGIAGLSICGLGWGLDNKIVPGIPVRRVIGKIKPRHAKDIKSSALGVGFETLDRKMFDPEKCYAPLGELGIKWARCQTGWNRCETVKGSHDFKWLDEVVDNLLAVGIQPWFNVGYGNALYTPGAKNDNAVGWIPENSDESRTGWNNFIRALALHYKGRVNHFELWNEPNVTPFWRPGKPTPEGYTSFIKRSSEVLRSVNPGAIIIGGAFSHFPAEFLHESLKLGLASDVNKISFHPYSLFPEENSKYQKDVNFWRDTLSKYDPAPELWQGECGAPSTDYSVGALSKYKWNESRQARWLLRRVINDLRLELEMISWYHTCDQQGYRLATYEAGKSGAYFGLLRMDSYTPKPSYFAYQTMCSLFDGNTYYLNSAAMKFNASEISGDKTIEQSLFSRNSFPVFAYWLAADVQEDLPARPVNITISIPQGRKLKKPVLIDPLNGEVFRLDEKKSAGKWEFQALPLKDYPMIITDARAFEMVG